VVKVTDLGHKSLMSQHPLTTNRLSEQNTPKTHFQVDQIFTWHAHEHRVVNTGSMVTDSLYNKGPCLLN